MKAYFWVFTIELCAFRYLSIFKETADSPIWGCTWPDRTRSVTSCYRLSLWMLDKHGHSPCFSWWMWKVLRLWSYTHTVHIFLGSRWTWNLAELQGIHEFTFPASVLRPSTTSQKIRKHTDFRKNRAFSSIVSLRIDSIAAMITKMVPTIRPPDAWLQKHGPRRLNSWDPNKLPYQLILVAYVVILWFMWRGSVWHTHFERTDEIQKAICRIDSINDHSMVW